jgi:7-keto-8-aminopelargonate synthetase-like enzyme
VFGTHGRGVAEQFGVEDAIDVHMGTLSKALGGLGGYIAGSRDLIDFLINRARSFIYTTALPPSVVAAARAALAIVSSDEGAALRRRVRQNADRLRGGLRARGLNPGSSASPIVPIILGDNDKTVTAGERLRDAGFLVGAVRPPTVPSGTARLRVSVTAAHTEEDLEGLLKALERVLGDVGSPTAGAGR